MDTGTQCRVPVNWKKERMRRIHCEDAEEAAAGVPQGSFKVVGGGAPADAPDQQRRMGIRRREYVDVPRSSLGPLESHWTADEMRDASVRAAAISQQELARVHAAAPPDLLSPAARAKAWERATTAANSRHLELGVSGNPPFSQLPYFRCVPVSIPALPAVPCCGGRFQRH